MTSTTPASPEALACNLQDPCLRAPVFNANSESLDEQYAAQQVEGAIASTARSAIYSQADRVTDPAKHAALVESLNKRFGHIASPPAWSTDERPVPRELALMRSLADVVARAQLPAIRRRAEDAAAAKSNGRLSFKAIHSAEIAECKRFLIRLGLETPGVSLKGISLGQNEEPVSLKRAERECCQAVVTDFCETVNDPASTADKSTDGRRARRESLQS